MNTIACKLDYLCHLWSIDKIGFWIRIIPVYIALAVVTGLITCAIIGPGNAIDCFMYRCAYDRDVAQVQACIQEHKGERQAGAEGFETIEIEESSNTNESTVTIDEPIVSYFSTGDSETEIEIGTGVIEQSSLAARIRTLAAAASDEAETDETVVKYDENAEEIEVSAFGKVELSPGCDGSSLETFWYNARFIPQYQRDIFNDFGWKFVFTDEPLEKIEGRERDENDPEHTCGLCSSRDKTIYILDENYAAQIAALHEMGHMMDYMQGGVSANDEFRLAFVADSPKYTKLFPYEHIWEHDMREAYAEAYKHYYAHPVTLRDNCPNIYSYFEARL